MEELNCIRGYHIYKEAWEAAVGEAFATLHLVHSGPSFNAFSTSLLVRAMACYGTWRLSETVGSGRPLLGLK